MRVLVRTAIRGLRRRRGVAATVVLTLAVGIGANSAVFSAVDAVLLKPLPYPDADRLVAVYELNQGLKQATQLVAPGRLEEWHAANRSFAGLAGSYFENVTDTTGAMPVRVEAMRTSERFFTVLGVGAALGRTLTPEEERQGGPSVVVLSDAFWRARFNSDPAAKEFSGQLQESWDVQACIIGKHAGGHDSGNAAKGQPMHAWLLELASSLLRHVTLVAI